MQPDPNGAHVSWRMNIPKLHLCIALICGITLTLGVQFLVEVLREPVQKFATKQPVVQSPEEENIDPEIRYGMKLREARDLIRTDMLVSDDEAKKRGDSETAQEASIYRFRRAINLLGRMSDELQDAQSMIRNFDAGFSSIGGAGGTAIAQISIRAAAKRGERVSLDPQFFKIWDDRITQVGYWYIFLFLDVKPTGYLDTISDWLSWLTQEDQFPKAPVIFDGTPYIRDRISAALKIIAALECRTEPHYRAAATTALEKLTRRYANDKALPEMMKRFGEMREWARDQAGLLPEN